MNISQSVKSCPNCGGKTSEEINGREHTETSTCLQCGYEEVTEYEPADFSGVTDDDR